MKESGTSSATLVGFGFDPIPLRPGTKYPLRLGWKQNSPVSQWRNAPENSNLGVRGVGPVMAAFLDCDHPMTFTNAVNWLTGLGIIDFPTVKSPPGGHDGYHIYVSFSGGLHGDYRSLIDTFGPGEFRYGRGAFVVAPPSTIDGNPYLWLASDLSQLPTIAVSDVLPILKNPRVGTDQELKHPQIGRATRDLIRGYGVERYRSRSEAEEAILAGLVNKFVSYDEILVIFMQYPCGGKFSELFKANPNNAYRYLRRSYNNVVAWTQNNQNPVQKLIYKLIRSSGEASWPGRTGSSDRAIYIAHLELAWRAAKLIYAASTRDLSERAGVSIFTASKATKRLLNIGLIDLNRTSTVNLATVYKLNPEKEVGGGYNSNTYTHDLNEKVLGLVPPRRDPNDFTLPRSFREEVDKLVPFGSHDLWRSRGLGKSSLQIYQALLNSGPMTPKELSDHTGRCLKTVKRHLSQMSSILDGITGEIIKVVEIDSDGKWSAVTNIDLDYLSEILGSAGIGFEQRKQHEAERRRHKRQLEEGRK